MVRTGVGPGQHELPGLPPAASVQVRPVKALTVNIPPFRAIAVSQFSFSTSLFQVNIGARMVQLSEESPRLVLVRLLLQWEASPIDRRKKWLGMDR